MVECRLNKGCTLYRVVARYTAARNSQDILLQKASKIFIPDPVFICVISRIVPSFVMLVVALGVVVPVEQQPAGSVVEGAMLK